MIRGLLLGLLALATTAGAYPTRGYVPQNCSVDFNHDGTPDCTNLCRGGATNVDIDGNGILDTTVYVNCSAGSDGTGTAASPRNSIQAALNSLASPGTARKIQAVCVKGTCNNAQFSPTVDGSSGTGDGATSGVISKAASGSEPRAWQYPRFPLLIMGWDADGDGIYPPADPDDLADLDGGTRGSGTCYPINAFVTGAQGGDRSRVEIAHLRFRDYGSSACTYRGLVFHQYGALSHIYLHDFTATDINYKLPATSDSRFFWVQGTQTYFSIENALISGFAGYLFRGAMATGPIRMQHVTAIGNACTSGCGGQGGWVVWKAWGPITGIDILDNFFDSGMPAVWTTPDNGYNYGLGFEPSAQDVVVRNNYLTNFVNYIRSEPTGIGETRAQSNFVIDANELEHTCTTGTCGPTFQSSVMIDMTGSRGPDGLRITNNILRGTQPVQTPMALWRSAGAGECVGGDEPGSTVIAGNTFNIAAAGLWDSGYLDFNGDANTTTPSCPDQDVTIANNLVLGGGAGDHMIQLNYAPSRFWADGNLYAFGANFTWSGSTKSDLAAWQTGLGGCPSTGRDCNAKTNATCTPDFVSLTNLHLTGSDTCARDAGQTLASLTTDIDGDGRPLNTIWDIGADEYNSGAPTTTTSTSTTISSTSTSTSTTAAPTTSTTATTTTTTTSTTIVSATRLFGGRLRGGRFR